MPADLQRARELFLYAVGQVPPELWEGYVRQACGGDGELEQQLRHLLQVHREAGSFLDVPAVARVGTAVEPLQEGPGAVIGPYRLLEPIGEGGFGVVFLAEQQSPVRRQVALKVLKPGMDSKQVIARFEAERQALALMDHPHIARVHDGGTTASGRPYFVMELVKGLPLTDYCDQAQLTLRQRLKIFVSVCQAVQHAHQKGLIHRDLKPSNVLVSVADGQPVVKVIDFGIAKALGGQLTEKTLFTGVMQMLGTPLYMSPEQAGLSPDIDTRSDIYALGVLLYELLTGSTPFPRERFQQADYDEICRIIREEEPPRPSTRLAESRDTLPTISEQRHSEPEKLAKVVRGELDWIVMKCLEKDRNRRYETANALAMDVRRYLADEPVQACPPSLGYRLRKLVRRHKVALTMAALILATLALAVTVLAVANLRISHALQERSQALTEKTEALRKETRANHNLAQALSWNSISLADREWWLNHTDKAERALDGCPEPMRHWEWHYLKRLCHRSLLLTLHDRDGNLADVAFSPDGKYLATLGIAVNLWDARTGQLLRTLARQPGKTLGRLAFTSDGKSLGVAAFNVGCKVWEVDTGQEVLSLPSPSPRLSFHCLAFAPDGKRLLVCMGAVVRVWNVLTGQEEQAFVGHTGDIKSLAFSPEGTRLVTMSRDRTMKLWEPRAGLELLTLRAGSSLLGGRVFFSPDGSHLVVTAVGKLCLWDGTPWPKKAVNRDGDVLGPSEDDKVTR